jgi:hypothetical protein
MNASASDKAAVSHVDVIQPAPIGENVLTGDERIIYQLEITGEEVGMTWRTVMAAAVLTPSSRSFGHLS